MPIVKDQNVRSIQPAAQVRDFYTRPAINRTNRLEQIASAYRGFSTNLGAWLDRQRKQREDIEIAQGMELYRKRLEHGEEFSANEMQEKAKNGDYEGFKDLTRFQKEGIRRIRHEIFGAKLQEHMLTWAGSATLPDENGNQIPLSMVRDTDRVINAFYQESARYAQEKTGGQYDPRLAQEHIRNAERDAFSQFVNHQAAMRNEQIRLEQQAVATEILDMTLRPLVNDGSFLTDVDGGKERFDTIIGAIAAELMQAGISETDARTFMRQYIQMTLRTTRDDDTIDRVHDLAHEHVLFQDPETRRLITAAAEDGRQANYYRQRRENEINQEQSRREAFDFFVKAYRGEATPEEIVAFTMKSYDNAQAYAAIQDIMEKGYSAATAMPPQEFDEYLLQARHGQIPLPQFMHDMYRMNNEQRDMVVKYLEYNEKKARQWAEQQQQSGRFATQADYNKWYASQLKQMKSIVDPIIASSLTAFAANLNAEQGVYAQERYKNHIYNKAMHYWEKWLANNPALASDPLEAEDAMLDAAYEAARQYAPNAAVYAAAPERLDEPPYPLQFETRKANVDTRLNQTKTEAQKLNLEAALAAKDEETVKRILRRQGVAKNALTSEARTLIADYHFVSEEQERRIKQERGE